MNRLEHLNERLAGRCDAGKGGSSRGEKIEVVLAKGKKHEAWAGPQPDGREGAEPHVHGLTCTGANLNSGRNGGTLPNFLRENAHVYSYRREPRSMANSEPR